MPNSVEQTPGVTAAALLRLLPKGLPIQTAKGAFADRQPEFDNAHSFASNTSFVYYLHSFDSNR